MSDQLEKAVEEAVRVIRDLRPGETVTVTRAKSEEEHVLTIGWKVEAAK